MSGGWGSRVRKAARTDRSFLGGSLGTALKTQVTY